LAQQGIEPGPEGKRPNQLGAIQYDNARTLSPDMQWKISRKRRMQPKAEGSRREGPQ
jgi:hypothetical protein